MTTPLLFQCDVPSVTPASAWQFFPADKDRNDMEFVPSEGFYRSKGGRLCSPPIPCVAEPFAFYRLRFHSRYSERGYYAVFFRDTQNKDLADDIYGSVDPSDQWIDNDYCFRGRESGRSFVLQFIGHGNIEVKNIRVENVPASDVCQWSDQLGASLPPFHFIAPADSRKHLPRTMQSLRTGPSLRIVMLGDSIINDTNNSNWDALVRRRYPHCALQIIASVRGSTGCWFYQDDDAFQSCVAAHKPQLLIIGGISHRNDLDAIDRVIQKAQTQLRCEILLLSGPMGKDWRPQNPAHPNAPLPVCAYGGDPFNNAMAKLAEQRGIAFLDMNTPWHQYLAASGKPWEYFHRDTVHANDRAKRILGQMLERYFQP